MESDDTMSLKKFLILCASVSLCLSVSGCVSDSSNSTSTASPSSTVSGEQTVFIVDIWVDNWFSLFVNGVPIDEDIEPITQERSFNAQSVEFTATYPITVAVITKDFMENESGLEYIGTDKQQIGDGGFILQIREKSSGNLVGVTSSQWSMLTIQRAPLNPACVSSADPLADCQSEVLDDPSGWQSSTFDDSSWSKAAVYSADQVKPKLGFNEIDWDQSASLIWGADLRLDNVLLWRTTFTQPE
jgi:hypothetical protein